MKKAIPFFLLLLTSVACAQKNYPVPPASANRLFYIQHNANHNTYVYDAVFSKPGELLGSNPVNIYRIVHTEGGVKKDLTFVQRKLAYGLDIKKISENNYELSLVSYPKQKLYLRLDKTGRAYVETNVNGKNIILNRMFLQSRTGSSGLQTKLDHILFFGKDVYGKDISVKFIP